MFHVGEHWLILKVFNSSLQQISDPVKDTTVLDNRKTMSEETYAPPLQLSQINSANLRKFLPEHASGLFIVLGSHFKNNNIRSQIDKFHAFMEPTPPSLIIHLENII
ncbi:hypothetical protein ACTXT7_008530 [Hymenolepis weldensis]